MFEKIKKVLKKVGYISKYIPSNIKRYTPLNPTESSVNISTENWKEKCNYIVLCNKEKYKTILLSAPLSAKYDAPILLVEKNSIDNNVMNEIYRLNAGNLFIVGGEDEVSKDLEFELYDNGFNTRRIDGRDYEEFTIKLALEFNKEEGILIKEDELEDAYSAASIAAINKTPILLYSKDGLGEKTKQYIKDNLKHVTIIGREKIVEDEIINLNITYIKYDMSGASNRNLNLIKNNSALNFKNIYLCRENKYLVAPTLPTMAYKNNSAIMFFKETLLNETRDILNSVCLSDIIIFASQEEISNETYKEITEIYDIKGQAILDSMNLLKYASCILNVEALDENLKTYNLGIGIALSEDGKILTNAHIVKNTHTVKAFFNISKKYAMEKVLYLDEERDIAIIQLSDAMNLKCLKLGDSDKIFKGEEILILKKEIGYIETKNSCIIKGLKGVKDKNIKVIEIGCVTPSVVHNCIFINKKGEVIGISSHIIDEGCYIVPITDFLCDAVKLVNN